MTDRPAAAIAIITLGVADVARATRFYEALGFVLSRGASQDTISFFRAGGVVLALFGRDALAHDAAMATTSAGPFGGITIARNLPSPEAVDAAFAEALAAGATALKHPEKVFWGGYSGYVADLDGHPIELAHNPFFPLGPDGTVTLPD
ncbi:VOC family protein [Phreatobacter aquaticus]|uniref:VOC family protein n=1 Tax=Phreatobacter aquaticus TaxID=2570229 RepID=A0A4D7QS00_9HYPH|nr:VOC family protein [Phreatobacter aquaticus]QCK88239.1 VOC family protein [Phreatobacter aquaticus]